VSHDARTAADAVELRRSGSNSRPSGSRARPTRSQESACCRSDAARGACQPPPSFSTNSLGNTSTIRVLTTEEETLVTSSEFNVEKFVQAAGDAIIAASTDGSIIFWNPAAERIFGYTESEALSHSLDLIIPERLRERHWEGYRQVMQSGRTRYGSEVLRVPAVHKDGRPLSIAFTVALLFSQSAHVQAIAAIIRDETTRWNEERALRQRVAALEAGRCPSTE
jgi:PAS domain S-box-containing protein